MLVIGSVFSQIFRSVIDDVNWNPSSIFYGGEPGVWYDPSDLTTLFQDSAGTTPVTAAGQTVGLMIDKSKGGIGPEILPNGNFSQGSTGWFVGTGWSISGGVATHTGTAGNLTSTPATDFTAGLPYVIEFDYSGNTDIVGVYVKGAFHSVISAASGHFRAVIIAGSAAEGVSLYATAGFVVDNFSAKLFAGNHATQATLAQRPTYQIDSTGRPYLSFDGVDDGMVTETITPSTDKVQVFAGLRKLSDAAQGVFAEMSATIALNAGAFALTVPNSAAANYNFSSKGTTQTNNVVTTYTAPVTSVISGLGDIGAASNLIRVNGAQVGSTLTTQGTGNYLAYSLYIGRRFGLTDPFNGRLYSYIMRFGPNLTTGQISSAESWVNGKTGAY